MSGSRIGWSSATTCQVANASLQLPDGTCDCIQAVWYADLAMKQQFCWEQIPVDLLKLIFETQVNALDNCAAACTCKAWRDAVHSSQIHDLRLHAISPSAASRWVPFLTARSAIHHLRLTSLFEQTKPIQKAKLEHTSEEEISSLALSSSFYGVPLSCSSVDATGYYADAFGQISTGSPAALSELTIRIGRQFLPTRDLWSGIPDLQHLHQLTKLRLKVVADRFSILDPLPCGLSKTPSTLHSLAVEGYSHCLPLSVGIPQMLTARLLTKLNLIDCTVRCIPGALADCLQGLTSLSLRESTVYGDNDFTVTRLTNLLQLDLAQAAWLVEDDQYLFLESFVGWPLLKILNICESSVSESVFSNIQVLDVSLVHEMYASWLTPGMVGAKIHILNVDRRPKLIADMLSLPYSALLVEVRVALPPYTLSSEASDILLDLMRSCRCLQTLQLSNQGIRSLQGYAQIAVPAEIGTRLQTLVLDDLWFSVIDLSFTTSLSTVSLITVDSCNLPCQLGLPSSLQSLTFIGDSLFGIEVNECQLAPLSHLTRLTLGVDGPNGRFAFQRALGSPAGVVRLPLLPSSLRHLHLWADERNYVYDFDYVLGHPFVDCCDWHCLDPCTNLERLTLPTCYSLKAHLKTFVQFARHLHIVEYVDDLDDID